MSDALNQPPSVWQFASFADILWGKIWNRQFYIGEGEEDPMDDLCMADILHEQDIIEEGELCPVVEIPWDSYKQAWQKWRRALVIKTLGKNFSFKVLEPRIKNAW